MTDHRQRQVDALRFRIGEVENDLVDELRGGRIDRREFVHRGTVLGLSLSSLGVLAGCAQPNVQQVSAPPAKPPRPGGTIRSGIVAPAAALDPVQVSDEGGLAVLGQTGEYLAWSDKNLTLRPIIAQSWKHDSTGKVWTFNIRRGVRFSDGTPLSAKDVEVTFNRLADPAVGSNALSTFAGVLSKGNVKATDPYTVEFRLDSPNGNFPYLVSSDNYNAIILPKTYNRGWDKTFIGTGPWKLESFVANQGVTLDHAVALANGTPYGLAAAVWSADVTRAHRLAAALRAGTVWVNTFDASSLATPFGGVRASGHGRDRSLHALETYTYLKTTWIGL